MKDIAPYTEAHQKLLEKIGFDIADQIPDEHEADAEFVIARDMKHWGSGGKYTGWIRNGQMNGKGTFANDINGGRFDGIWKDGLMQGTGRFMWYDGWYAEQATFANSKPLKPVTRYESSGEVTKY